MYSENTYADNSDLLKRIKDGDESALDELVNLNMGLVKSIALRFQNRGVEYEDLIQIGTIGMIKAARSFDFSFNTAFSTYAVPLIIGELRRFLRDDGIIKVSRGTKKQGINIMKQRETFIRDNGREPKTSELAALCDMEPNELVYALESVSPIHSLSEQVGSDEGLTLDDVIADKDNAIENVTDKIALSEALKKLPELQQQIIILRYCRELSQQQTGDILGLTQVKISREEKKILEKLKGAL
jgi:RNA polymerase sporulation-specific sigma factor